MTIELEEPKVTIEDLFRTAEQMDDHYNSNGYGEHPLLTRECWRHEVFDSNTQLGYWDWVVYELEANLDIWAEKLYKVMEKVTKEQMIDWIVEDHMEAIFGESGENYIRDIITEGLTGLDDMTPQQLFRECYEQGLLARHDILEE